MKKHILSAVIAAGLIASGFGYKDSEAIGTTTWSRENFRTLKRFLLVRGKAANLNTNFYDMYDMDGNYQIDVLDLCRMKSDMLYKTTSPTTTTTTTTSPTTTTTTTSPTTTTTTTTKPTTTTTTTTKPTTITTTGTTPPVITSSTTTTSTSESSVLVTTTTMAIEDVHKEAIEYVYNSINAAREEAGIKPLSISEILQEAAFIRATELGQSFEAMRPDGTRADTLIKGKLRYSYFRQIYYRGKTSYRSTFDSIKLNEETYKNFLNPNYNQVGAGVHYANGSYYLDIIMITGF